MAAIYGGLSCQDPSTFRISCLSAGLPTDSWWGRANGFDLAPVGREPGRGWLLLTKADLDALDTGTDHTLTFTGTTDDNSISLLEIATLKAACLSPGHEDDPHATFLVEVTDRRHHLARVPLDAAFNVVAADGEDYLEATTNSGTPWTWQEVVDELATACGLATAEFVLPVTPDGTPENLAYWGGMAWESLCDVLDRIACAPVYDAEEDTFSVVSLGEADATAENAMGAAHGLRTWDDYPTDPVRAWRPQKVRVLFDRRPRPTDGSSPYYSVDVTLAAASGVVSGSYVQLHDDATAIGATGTPSNSAALATRASERAADWLRKRSGFGRPLLKVYRDFLPGIVRDVPGATVGSVALDDRGGPMRTEVVSRPDRRLEDWRPLSQLPPWFPPDAGGGFFARLTDSGTNATTSTTGWDFIRVAYTDDSGWGWHDDSAETTGYPAFPSTIDGTNTCNPVGGLRVWMVPSATTDGLYEFLPIGYASGTYPGIVSITTQTFAGNKTFAGNTHFVGTVTGDSYALFDDFVGTADNGNGGARLEPGDGTEEELPEWLGPIGGAAAWYLDGYSPLYMPFSPSGAYLHVGPPSDQGANAYGRIYTSGIQIAGAESYPARTKSVLWLAPRRDVKGDGSTDGLNENWGIAATTGRFGVYNPCADKLMAGVTMSIPVSYFDGISYTTYTLGFVGGILVEVNGATILECGDSESGSGGGGGGGGGDFYCFDMGDTVEVTVSNVTGDCDCLPGSFTLTRYTGEGAYEYEWRSETGTYCNDPSVYGQLCCPCSINPWAWNVGLGGQTVIPVSQDEETRTLVWDLVIDSAGDEGCTGSARFTLVGSG